MTTPDEDAPDSRSLELEVEVPGAPEQVWEAIATGPGITSWLHPTEVEEREGGELSFDMGAGMTFTGRVAGWDPPHRFVEESEWKASEDEPPALLVTEWLVEARSGGTCVVRMVTSGFGTGASWDEEIEGFGEAMRDALDMLRAYLTHFSGRRGSWMRVFGKAEGSLDEAWAALTAALGLSDAAEGEEAKAGGSQGPSLSGVVERRSEAGAHMRNPCYASTTRAPAWPSCRSSASDASPQSRHASTATKPRRWPSASNRAGTRGWKERFPAAA